MYLDAYELLVEILKDEILNEFVFEETGKHLAIIDAGAQITIPAVKITFEGGETSYADNTAHEVRYTVSFALPFWGADALKKSHEFLDVAMGAFFGYEQRLNPVHIYRVQSVNPSIIEQNEESEVWTITFNVTVLVFN